MHAFSLARVAKAAGIIFFLTISVNLHRSSFRSRYDFGAGSFLIRADPIRPISLQARRAKDVPLRLSAAWRLTSQNPAFGGISALSVSGPHVFAMTDIGGRLAWTRTDGGTWRVRLSLMPEVCRDTTVDVDRDTESLVVDAAARQQWVGFEMRNVICRLSADGNASVRAPAEMKDWPDTGGAEAMVRLRDGRFLVFAERSVDDHSPLTPLIIFDRDPVSRRAVARQIFYHAPLGTRPVDAAELPDGRLLVLNRRFDFPFSFTVVLALADPRLSADQSIMKATPIAWFAKGLSAENWEAISIEDLGKGRARIWMASDDNFMGIQKTMLLKLDWQEEAAPPAL